MTSVQVGQSDQSILATADGDGAIVITADKWFLNELHSLPAGHRRRLREAGVVQVPGERSLAQRRLHDYLPLIELVYRLRKSQADRRVGIDLSPIATIRILEARLLAPVRRSEPRAN